MIRRNLMCLLLLISALCYAIPAQQPATPAQPQTPPAQKQAPAVQPPAPPASAPTPAAADAGSDLVVVRVAGEPITEKQVLSAVNFLSRQKLPPPDAQQSRNVLLFNGAVENLTIELLLKKIAREQNVVADKSLVDQQMEALAKQFPTPEAYKKALASQGMTEEQLRKNVENSMSMQQVLNIAVKNVPQATDAEAQKFYDDNADKFPVPEQAHAAHILLLADPKGTDEQKAEIKKKIEGIRADIEAGKITFADAAKQFSQDPGSASNGGDLGFFPRGQMVKPFEEAAFSGKPGTLSGIIESQYGYHIIQTLEVKPAGKASLEEAKSSIKLYLDRTSKTKAIQQYTADLKAKAAIENFMTPEEFLKRHPEIK
jgi:peptidyl-prolyl cis-trans isomerase C